MGSLSQSTEECLRERKTSRDSDRQAGGYADKESDIV